MGNVTLSSALSERVEKAARERGTDAEALIEELLGPPFVVDEVEAVREALEASARRQGRPLEEWYADHLARHPRPAHAQETR
jgi:hypothetical protein